MEEQRLVEEGLEIRRYFRVLLKHKWLITGIALPLTVIVAIAVFKMRPVYQATTQILIEKEAPKVVKIEEVMPAEAKELDYYKTQYEILKSRSLGRMVVKELDLKKHPEFDLKRQSSGGLIGRGPQDEDEAGVEESRLIDIYLSKLQIRPLRDTRLANISFKAYDPKLAASVANAHAKAYIRQNMERRLSASQEAVQWLLKRIEEVRQKLEESQRAMDGYRRENNLISLDLEERENIILKNLTNFNSALTEAEREKIEKEQLFKEVKRSTQDNRSGDSLSGVITNPLIQRLKEEYSLLQANYAQLLQRYGPMYPKMVETQARLKEVEERLKAESQQIAKGVEAQYRIATGRVQKIKSNVETLKREALQLGQKRSQYDILKRQAETNQTLHDSLLKRVKETGVVEELKTSNISIIDPAEVPKTPVAPRKKLYIALALLIGIGGGALVAFLIEAISNTITTPEDVEKELGLPLLGAVGRIKGINRGKRSLVALTEEDEIASEGFRSIRTNIIFSMTGPKGKTLLVSSSSPEEGKTLLAANLAVAMALAGKETLLVDGDMRNPRVHDIFELPKSPGLTEVLVGEAPWPSALQMAEDPLLEKLKIITSGHKSPNPSELLGSEGFQRFINEARDRFDFILLDSSPIMMVADSAILAKAADRVVLTVKAGETPREVIRQAIKQLRAIDVKILGVVLNRVEFAKHYGYYYHYYRGYYGRGEKGISELPRQGLE